MRTALIICMLLVPGTAHAQGALVKLARTLFCSGQGAKTVAEIASPVAAAAQIAEAQEFLVRFGDAYHDFDHTTLEVVPSVAFQTVNNPDPLVFQRSADGTRWVNRNPDAERYVYSASASGYVPNGRIRNVDLYRQKAAPRLREITGQFDPALENEIRALEDRFRTHVVENGFRGVPSFALRGISTEGSESLAAWKDAGYISEGGGNFFVFEPGSEVSADAFLAKLMASSATAYQYGGRASQPVVLFIRMDLGFRIPPSGGNDGITGAYPWTLGELQLENLDVGAITRPGTRRQVGLIGDGVPADRVTRTIGSDGLPAWATNPQDPEQRVAIFRWVYRQVLDEVVTALP